MSSNSYLNNICPFCMDEFSESTRLTVKVPGHNILVCSDDCAAEFSEHYLLTDLSGFHHPAIYGDYCRPVTKEEIDHIIKMNRTGTFIHHEVIDGECMTSWWVSSTEEIEVMHQVVFPSTNEDQQEEFHPYLVCYVSTSGNRLFNKDNKYQHLFDVRSNLHGKFLDFRRQSIKLAKFMQVLKS